MRKWRTVTSFALLVAVVGGMLVARSTSGTSKAGSPGGVNAALASAGAIGSPTGPAGRAGARSSKTFGPNVGHGTFVGISRAVRDLPAAAGPPRIAVSRELEKTFRGPAGPVVDPVVQTEAGNAPAPSPAVSFDGMCLDGGEPCAGGASTCSCLPPDTNGEVGQNQYVQTVNSSVFAVFGKTGTVLKAATDMKQLYSSGFCADAGTSDPVVLYDQLAGRWILSYLEATQLGASTNGECVAVSTSGDATGTYYTYSFDFGGTLMDYPKLAVWPDGYYLTANEFPPNAVLSEGVLAMAMNRDDMLAGTTPRTVSFDEGATNLLYCCQLPADLDGTLQPPGNSPEYLIAVDDPSSLPTAGGFVMSIWKFDVDWTNPANSTLGNSGLPNSTIPVAAFARPQCVYGHPPANCVPQFNGLAGPAQEALDVLPGYLMFRLAYRNYGNHESLVINHSVNVTDPNTQNTRIGIRWYELRSPGSTPTIYQQGTYAPADTSPNLLWRWMGSAAMDGSGDLALGYSASGPQDYPTIRYAGRKPSDPLGQLSQSEVTVPAGPVPYGGPEVEAEGRWGDYSDMSVDPTDDCTFWYTQEYLSGAPIVILGANWRTRIAAFKFPTCQKPTAVQTAWFGSRWTRNGVLVSWRTASESGAAGFNVWRSRGKGWTRVNARLVPAKRAGRAGGASYRLVDRSAKRGRVYAYRLQLVGLDGRRSWYGVGSTPVR